jgi:aconitate hydratase
VPAIIARSYARIHRRNLIAVGIVPLVFSDETQWSVAQVGQRWWVRGLADAVRSGADAVTAEVEQDGPPARLSLRLPLSPAERDVLQAGGLLAHVAKGGRRRLTPEN